MNNILKIVALVSVVAALAACAQKPNQVKPPPTQKATGDGLDPLKDKSAADVLKLKYKTLFVVCDLKAVEAERPVPANAVADSLSIDPPPTSTPPPAPPIAQPVVDGLKLTYDLKEQVKADESLSKSVTAQMKSADGKTTVFVAIRPVDFQEIVPAVKVGSIVRLRKHSPGIAILASLNDVANAAVKIELAESVPLDTVLNPATESAVQTKLVLGCKLEGEIVDGFKDQNIDINCANTNPPEEQKALFKANCPQPQ